MRPSAPALRPDVWIGKAGPGRSQGRAERAANGGQPLRRPSSLPYASWCRAKGVTPLGLWPPGFALATGFQTDSAPPSKTGSCSISHSHSLTPGTAASSPILHWETSRDSSLPYASSYATTPPRWSYKSPFGSPPDKPEMGSHAPNSPSTAAPLTYTCRPISV